MTYIHLTIDELIMIEKYFDLNIPVTKIAKSLNRARQTIYNVVNYFKLGFSAYDYIRKYKLNKSKCGRKKIVFTDNEKKYIEDKVKAGWLPDIIIGRSRSGILDKDDIKLNCSAKTIYRRFKEGEFNVNTLPMKGKRKPNKHIENRGRQGFVRTIRDRENDYSDYDSEFGHLEGDSIIGKNHKSSVLTLVEKQTKCIIAIKPNGRKASDTEKAINDWLSNIPKNLFKSITFDCGKEFSNWKNISNKNDINIYFADPGRPSQRGLNENSNGLLRRDGLSKGMDFNKESQNFISNIANKRNNIPRKSLNYLTPFECFMSYINNEYLANLI